MKNNFYHSMIAADMIAKSNQELGSNILYANRQLGDTLKSISDTEIKSKNRVDITLEEYENMKNEIKRLSYNVDVLSNILNQIKIPLDKIDEIIPDSIKTYWCDNPCDFNKRRFVVEFDINHRFGRSRCVF